MIIMKFLLVVLFCFTGGFPTFSQQEEKKVLSISSRNKKNLPLKNQFTTASIKKIEKRDFLPASYYKAKKQRKELLIEFDTHLSNIKKSCTLSKNRKKRFDKILKNLILFLKESLKDPYIFHNIKMRFGSLLGTIEPETNQAIVSLEDFNVSYFNSYKLPKNLKMKDYPHNWAKVISKALTCLDR